MLCFFFQAEDGIRDIGVTGVQTCALPISTWGDLLFAWRVAKHVTSNAIVLARDLQTIGVGAGQMSRVDAARIAIDKARELGHDVPGAALASDAFFPFPDGPALALEAGVRSLIQPGGSKRDSEVVETVEGRSEERRVGKECRSR